MSDADKEIEQTKVSDTISTETAMLAVSLVLFVHQNPDLIHFMAQVLSGNPSRLPVPDNLKQRLESPLKQAAELLVGAQVLNGFVRHRTAERAVTFIYIALRYLLYLGKIRLERRALICGNESGPQRHSFRSLPTSASGGRRPVT